ncbi:MAG TPA: LIC_13355 family lipoprotein [Kofleriaceae bacterium]|jgi:hypothetical protein|nr:LIC_13355 family lipoprotein [Kofleriaceae bacterium]
MITSYSTSYSNGAAARRRGQCALSCWLVRALALAAPLASGCVQYSGATDDPDPGHGADPAMTGQIATADTLAENVRLADTVVDAPGATGTGFGDPTRAVNGVRGAGSRSGSLDVFSLGYTPGVNDHITLAWSHGRLQNGPGPDLAVFENPFLINGGGVFMDLIIVEVSLDGVEFRALAHDYTATDPTVYHNNPALWSGFAGKTPVLLNVDTNPVAPFNATAAGGDQFDLDTVEGADAVAQSIRTNGARFVRLTSAPARINPDTGAAYVHDALSNGADIDGIYGRYLVSE